MDTESILACTEKGINPDGSIMSWKYLACSAYFQLVLQKVAWKPHKNSMEPHEQVAMHDDTVNVFLHPVLLQSTSPKQQWSTIFGLGCKVIGEV